MSNANHVVADPRLLRCPVRTEADHDKSRPDLACLVTPVLVHSGSRRCHLGVAVSHPSSLRLSASLSRIAMSSGTRGDVSALASASLRCASAIPRSLSASTRSSSTLITGPVVATGGADRTSTVMNVVDHPTSTGVVFERGAEVSDRRESNLMRQGLDPRGRTPRGSIGQYPRVTIVPGLENPKAATWSDPDRVDRYLTRIGGLAPRAAGEEVLVSVLPDSPRSVLDLGCGDGWLAALVLDHRPGVENVSLWTPRLPCSTMPEIGSLRVSGRGPPRVNG